MCSVIRLQTGSADIESIAESCCVSVGASFGALFSGMGGTGGVGAVSVGYASLFATWFSIRRSPVLRVKYGVRCFKVIKGPLLHSVAAMLCVCGFGEACDVFVHSILGTRMRTHTFQGASS